MALLAAFAGAYLYKEASPRAYNVPMNARAFALFLAVSLPLSAATFRASAVRVEITPHSSQWLLGYQARQSTGVHDAIYHRVVAMDSGDAQFYLISTDLCLYSPALYDDVAAALKKEAGVDPKNIWWSVTHSHATPEIGPPSLYAALLGRSDHPWDRDYTATVTKALIEAVRAAREKLEPARISFGEGISLANINRRAKDPNGRVSLGLNPDGPTDRQIGLIRLERADGGLIALIVNYAMHGTVMDGHNLLISGDAPGTVTAYLESKLGGTVLYEQGAAGNLAPIYSVYPDARSGHLSEFNVLLGDKILDAARRMSPPTADVSLWLGQSTIDTPRKPSLAWPDDLAAYSASEAGRAMVKLPVRFLRINDAIVWSLPVELFCEMAVNVRNHSPFTHTFYFGYTNGWFGYLPTAQAFQEGGYEPDTSPFTNQAEADVNRAVISFIQGLPR